MEIPLFAYSMPECVHTIHKSTRAYNLPSIHSVLVSHGDVAPQNIPSLFGTATGGGRCPAALPGLSFERGGGAGFTNGICAARSIPSRLAFAGVGVGERAERGAGDAVRDAGERGVGERRVGETGEGVERAAGMPGVVGLEVVVVMAGSGGTGGTGEGSGQTGAAGERTRMGVLAGVRRSEDFS